MSDPSGRADPSTAPAVSDADTYRSLGPLFALDDVVDRMDEILVELRLLRAALSDRPRVSYADIFRAIEANTTALLNEAREARRERAAATSQL